MTALMIGAFLSVTISSPKSPIFGDENNGKGMDHTGIMGNGNYRAIQQYEVEYGVKKLLNEIPENHSSTIEHHIKGCDYN